MRGLARTEEMLGIVARVVPQLRVDRARSRRAIPGGVLATDEVMRRVESGVRFRAAYREVAAQLKRGETFPSPSDTTIVARRSSTGGLGNLALGSLASQARTLQAWQNRERRRFDAAMRRLEGAKGK